MCLFVERLLNLKKSMCKSTIRSLKEPFRDALRKRLNFHSLSFNFFLFFYFGCIIYIRLQCNMHFYVVHTVFVEKAEISCHHTYLEILNLRL